MRQSRLLALTGGSGFVGRCFAALARERGYRIRHLGRPQPGTALSDDEFGKLDLEGPAPEAALLSGCDALVHLAAYLPRDYQDPAEAERCWRVNALGSLRLLEAAARAGIRQVIQASSANAYAPTTLPPTEDAPLFPQSRSYYLGSKIMQEIYAAQYGRSAGLNIATLRLSSVYGPGQISGAVGSMVSAAMRGGPIRIAGSESFGSDLVLVDDVAQALLLAIEGSANGPYNVGSGVRTTIAELAEMLSAITQAPIRRDPGNEASDWGFPALNIMRMRELGYSPAPLSAGLNAMIASTTLA